MDKDIFEIDLDNINIEDIMNQIRKKIQEKGIIDEEIEFGQISSEEEMLPEYLRMINNLWDVNSYSNIHSHRKVIGKIIIFIKKIIRKSIFWYINPIVQQQNQFNAFATRTLNSMTAKLNNMEEEIRKTKEIEKNHNDRLEKIEQKDKIMFDYVKFEDKYRGSQEDIKKRLLEYLKYFEGKHNVLDIGCGRGEFLQILKENNIEAKGIDINNDMLLLCREKNLIVENIDALTYLNSLEDNSLGGIMLTQVIEHMEPNYLIQLISLAYKKLKPEAYFIAETINPQSLIVFTEAYFMDLSHIRMIHPYTIKFLLENEGFKDSSIKYLSKVGDDLRIPEVNELPTEFNKAINKLNDVVYGYRDYAIIGRK
jgi:O-antigen chain-terminating methyltransferase